MFDTIILTLKLDVYGWFVGLFFAGVIIIPIANEIVSGGIFDYLKSKNKEISSIKAWFRPAFSLVMCIFWLASIWEGTPHFGGVEVFPALLIAMYVLQYYLGTRPIKLFVDRMAEPKQKSETPKTVTVTINGVPKEVPYKKALKEGWI